MRLTYSQIDFSNAKIYRRVLAKISPFYAITTRKIWKHSNHSKSTFHENTFLWKFIWYSNRIIGCFPRIKSYPVSISFDCHVKMSLDLSRLTDCFAYCFNIGESEIGYLCERFCKPTSNILDIGANIGTTTLFFAKCCPEGMVYAYEPSQSMRECLVRNIALNHLNNVHVNPYGLSNKKGRAAIKLECDYNPGSGFVSYDGDGEKVDLTTLDDDLSIVHKIDFIKIDVEGHEKNVLIGGEKTICRSKPFMIIEINQKALERNNAKQSDIYSILKKWNYKVYIVKSGMLLKIEKDNQYPNQIFNVFAIHESRDFKFK